MDFVEVITPIAEEDLWGLEQEEEGATKDNMEKSCVEPATHENVFCLRRQERSQSWTVGCFFNSGSLNCDDLLKQVLTVIAASEVVGLQIKLQVSDAGGANARALAMLTGTVGMSCGRESQMRSPAVG